MKIEKRTDLKKKEEEICCGILNAPRKNSSQWEQSFPAAERKKNDVTKYCSLIRSKLRCIFLLDSFTRINIDCQAQIFKKCFCYQDKKTILWLGPTHRAYFSFKKVTSSLYHVYHARCMYRCAQKRVNWAK